MQEKEAEELRDFKGAEKTEQKKKKNWKEKNENKLTELWFAPCHICAGEKHPQETQVKYCKNDRCGFGIVIFESDHILHFAIVDCECNLLPRAIFLKNSPSTAWFCRNVLLCLIVLL